MLREIITVIAVLIGACCMYWLRTRSLRIYGVGEIAVGFAVIVLNAIPHGPQYLITEYQPPLWDWLISYSVSLILGAYIIVRGLDNVDAQWGTIWRRAHTKLRETMQHLAP